MEVEDVKCECCGLKEECTVEYINTVKENFNGKWLCGLCSVAVSDEVNMNNVGGVDDAVRAHMSFCSKYKTSPASSVVDGMRQILRRRSGDMSLSPSPSPSPCLSSSSSSKAYVRLASDARVF